MCVLFLFVAAFAGAVPVLAQQGGRPGADMVLIKGARVVTMAGSDLDPGDVLIRKGKITAVGQSLKVPRGVRVIDASGKTVIPGLIDAYSALLRDGSSGGRPGAASRAADGIDVFRKREIESALSRCVTAAAVFPSARYGISGKAAVVRLAAGAPVEEMLLAEDAALKATIGHGSYGRPLNRLAEIKNFREALKKAKEYGESLEDYEEDLKEYVKKIEERAAEEKKKEEAGKKEEKKNGKDKKDADKAPEKSGGKAPEKGGKDEKKQEKKPEGKDAKKEEEIKKPAKPRFDAASAELLEVLAGKRPLFVEVHRAADILNLLDVVEEYPVRLVLAGCTEGYLVADAIADSGATVVLGPPVRSHVLENSEFRNHDSGCAAVLIRAGVPVILASTGRSASETRFLGLYAAQAVAHGVDRRTALEAVTIGPARLFGLDDRIGSLEKGKEADLAVITGDPLSAAAVVETVFVKGKAVYQREE